MYKKLIFAMITALSLMGWKSTTSVMAATIDPANSQNTVEQTSKTDDTEQDGTSSENSVATTPDKPKPQKQGWVVKGKSTYYYQSGKKAKGVVKIGQSHYLFNKNGVMLTGVRKTPHKTTYSYYKANGKRSENSASTKKAYYWIKKGKITGIKNNAKVVSQRPELPTGCEMTAVTMMLNFAGVKVSKFTVAKKTPRSSNPDKGFIGSPYKEYPGGYWVTPNGIKGVVKHYLGKAEVMTGDSLTAVKNKLLHSHLVVAWVKDVDGFSNHALALTGYHNGQFFYNDPWTGKKAAMSESSFLNHWRGDGLRALSY
ncbi:C39 family peptidase [Lactobacillus sp. ESL0731]|uniref:C39 family peptidase n=1 Tax=unclassified Lactobacillus TaxID=2620435 RepID=UPI0023F8423E|nr:MULTISPECIES: C39 family peptidase [unclassified Lactobacillus]WEV50672.1 C39 family peptidase [Lactobacillus sp. ESL0700]WEV61802.1 C39 family peptidase [Lactobacillus sp. ESL0731]